MKETAWLLHVTTAAVQPVINIVSGVQVSQNKIISRFFLTPLRGVPLVEHSHSYRYFLITMPNPKPKRENEPLG